MMILLVSCDNKYEMLNLDIYEYRDTKRLVEFIYDCSLEAGSGDLLHVKEFALNREDYCYEGYYLYIYKMDGTNVFHSTMPELEGKNIMGIQDINGKRVLELIVKEFSNKQNPHAWVHFTWCQPGTFFPVPKSSCHFKVITTDGVELIVGGGLDYPQEEKEFARIVVDTAVDLLREHGNEALEDISDFSSGFNFRDVRTFVLSESGEILISPFTGNNVFEFDLLNSVDEVGHKPFITAMEKLETSDFVWQNFMAKNRYKRIPQKRCIYLRKVGSSKENLIVGAITDLPLPPWSS